MLGIEKQRKIMENKQKTWVDYPYQFAPKGKMTTTELTAMLGEMFAIKAFPEEFVDALPDNLKKHFSKRDKPEQAPTKGDK